MLDSHRPPFFSSLVDLLRYRATKQPNDRAYVFLSDQGQEESVLTFAELDQRASDVAARLAHSQIGDRAFEPRVMCPLYGMAEATVLISGGRRGAGPVIRTVSRDAFQRHQVAPAAGRDDAHRVVGCGRNIIGQRIAIVDPETRRRLEADRRSQDSSSPSIRAWNVDLVVSGLFQ